jgi:segregation and condensation protein A
MQEKQFEIVELGNKLTKIIAKGLFKSSDALDFVPTPESIYFHVDTPNYDGPLDLLLHLLNKHSIDIFDIPIAFITEKYLDEINHLKDFNLDIAGEFILMAAMLTQIKSRMLLPPEEKSSDMNQEPDLDPRAELVKRLLAYKTYKEAAEIMGQYPQLNKNFFTRANFSVDENLYKNNEENLQNLTIQKIEIFSLIDNLANLLKRSEHQTVHTITRDRISISARIRELMDFCHVRNNFSFYDAIKFFTVYDKIDIIVTFLAVLEMCKLKLLKIEQIDNNNIYLDIVKENFYQANLKDIDEGYNE